MYSKSFNYFNVLKKLLHVQEQLTNRKKGVYIGQSDAYLYPVDKASPNTEPKSLANSGPFFLLFCITSLARYM